MTTLGVLVRMLVCLAVVFATWNPTGYSYFSWVRHSPTATLPEMALAGSVLLALHILFARIAWLSLGADGVTGALAVMFAGLLTLWEFDVIDLWRGEVWSYLLLLGFAMLLALGIIWSLFKRRAVGQSNYLSPPP